MKINDRLVRSFISDPTSMRKAKSIVVHKYEINTGDFMGILNGALAKACNSWDEHLSSFNSYVITSLNSECIDFLRRNNQPFVDIAYADNVAVDNDMANTLHLRKVLEKVLDRITESEHADLLLRVLVCGENYKSVVNLPPNARKVVERFRQQLRDEFVEELK